MNPYSRNPVVRFAARYGLLDWLGLSLAMIPLVLSAFGGPESITQLFAVYLSGVLTALITVSVLKIGQRRDAVEAKFLHHHYRLEGKRGERCTGTVTLRLISRTDNLPSFLHSKRKASGSITVAKTQFRNHEKNEVSDALRFLTLTSANIDIVDDLNGEELIHIRPPAVVNKGELIEVVIEELADNCFSADSEFVEKEVIFPIEKLKFEIDFVGCQGIINCAGTATELGMAARATPLPPVTQGDVTSLTWEVPNARPGDRYRLTWHWA